MAPLASGSGHLRPGEDAVFRMRWGGGKSLVGIVKSGRPMWISSGYGRVDPRALALLRRLRVRGDLVARNKPAEWKYVPIRRLAVFIETSLNNKTRDAGFELNGLDLWRRLRSEAGAFMRGLFEQGVLRGCRRKDAYFARCDATTTTQTDIDNGIVNLLVGFAPLQPAEFVVIPIAQMIRPS